MKKCIVSQLYRFPIIFWHTFCLYDYIALFQHFTFLSFSYCFALRKFSCILFHEGVSVLFNYRFSIIRHSFLFRIYGVINELTMAKTHSFLRFSSRKGFYMRIGKLYISLQSHGRDMVSPICVCKTAEPISLMALRNNKKPNNVCRRGFGSINVYVYEKICFFHRTACGAGYGFNGVCPNEWFVSAYRRLDAGG